MAKKKTKTQCFKNEVLQKLRDCYHISDKELDSGSFYYGEGNLMPDEVIPDLEREYGIKVEKKEFLNWAEVVESVATKVARKRKF